MQRVAVLVFALMCGTLSTYMGNSEAEKIVAFLIVSIVGLAVGIGLTSKPVERNETLRVISIWALGLPLIVIVGIGIARFAIAVGIN